MEAQMLIAQGVGMIATVIVILSFQWKETRKLFLAQIFSNLLFTLHYLLLGAYTGLLLNGTGLLRVALLYFGKGKWVRHPATMIALMALMALCCAVTWEGWLSLLPTIAQVFGTPLFFKQNGKLLRWGQLCFMSPCWLIYNCFNFSIPGIVADSLNITSVIVSLIRFRGKLGPEEMLPQQKQEAVP